jgi:Tol biopolymer transport system component
MKLISVAFTCLLFVPLLAQTPVGIFQSAEDIGKPKNAGSTTYNQSTQTYTLKGAGYNVWFNRDEFHYAWSKIKGDFILTANFAFNGAGTNPHRKIGWMVRFGADPEAAHASAVYHGDGLTALQWRELRGAFMRDPEDEIFFPKKKVQIIQVERAGKKIIMRVANPGEPLQLAGEHEMSAMPDEVLAGLFICSHDAEVVEEATVWNVRIDKPVADNHNPGRDGQMASRLEILDVFDGTRRVIHEADGRFEAPNWTPDGKSLIFNQGGALYKIPVEGGTPGKINTGIADRNNNDHGISFDGKMLAISHHIQGMPGGGSTIYVMPLEGGTPKQITTLTPSYWHGWSPNNKEVLFVGQREGNTTYNLYRVPIDGGLETPITKFTTGHVDGPEYSPDGKYIYYNGNQTGTMQLWRMKPDGSSPEQLTFDEYHNWFPHISPDGKWIVYISFPPTIEPNAHPSYKRVTLRLIPAAGGAPRVIAYLYGGQGTINVPSWSKDNRRIAFVSNSELKPK